MGKLAFDFFIKKIRIKAPLEVIYRMWSTSAGLESWFLRSAQFYRDDKILGADELVNTGDRYTWQWHNWDPTESCDIIEANGRDHLLFSFGGSSKVSVDLEQSGDSVMVVLRQYDIPTDEKTKLEVHVGCSNGWTFWLANLKAFLEHGIVLNETEYDISDDQLAGWEFVNI